MNNMIPEVSVIMPCYNQVEYLPDALNSVMAQSFQNWECIIINDGSTDNTATIVKEYINTDERFKYFEQTNGGPSTARNTAIRNSKGLFILPLDGDDKISSNYIEECVKTLSITENAKVVYGKGEKFGLINERWNLKPYSFQELLFGNSIHCAGMFRKADWESIGGYDTNMKEGLEDWEFWIHLLNKDAMVIKLDHITFFWRIKPKSRTSELNQGDKVAKLNRYVYCKHADLYNEFFIDPLKLYKEYIEADKIAKYADVHPFRFFCSRQWKKIKNSFIKKST